MHPKWDERPIVVVLKKPGAELSREDLLKFYQGKAAKWQVPGNVVFLHNIPMGATTSKMQKARLRQVFRDYQLPDLCSIKISGSALDSVDRIAAAQ